MSNFLDNNGLLYFWQSIKNKFLRGNVGGVFYGTSSTAAGTAAKVVECAAFTATDLVAGTVIAVKFINTNSGAVASLTLNVNGTGAKNIKYINNGTIENLPSEDYLKVDTTYYFYYDGIYWVALFNYNTTYSAMSEAEALAGTATTSRTITAAQLKQAVEYFAELDDVQINGTSIVENGVANIPLASTLRIGAVAVGGAYYGIDLTGGGTALYCAGASDADIKKGTQMYKPINPKHQHQSAFYGLAKAAGDTTQSQSSNTVGQYTDNAKDSIQNMLGITPLIASHESDPFESAHVVGELFIIGGKLYRAKTALTAGEYVNEGTNVEVVSVAGVLDGKVDDVQINGTSIVQDGVANVPIASRTNLGAVSINNANDNSYGLAINDSGMLYISSPSAAMIKQGTQAYKPIVPNNQHISTFYGLAKAAGDTTQSQSSNGVGNYTEEAKSAIRTMLGLEEVYQDYSSALTALGVI